MWSDSYLSYSGYKRYNECPSNYYLSYVAKAKSPEPDNKVNSLYGKIVGSIFESFYRDRVWRKPDVVGTLENMVEGIYQRTLQEVSEEGTVKWKRQDVRSNYEGPEELLSDVRKAVLNGVLIIRHHRLLGPDADAEVKLNEVINGVTLGGRADFLMHRMAPHKDLIILDGKGTLWGESYVDPAQLLWYAMLYRLRFNIMPDKLGFLFWRRPPEKAITWIDFSPSDVDRMQEKALATLRHITDGKGVPSPKEHFRAIPGKSCKYCVYLSTCPQGISHVPRGGVFGVEDVSLQGEQVCPQKR